MPVGSTRGGESTPGEEEAKEEEEATDEFAMEEATELAIDEEAKEEATDDATEEAMDEAVELAMDDEAREEATDEEAATEEATDDATELATDEEAKEEAMDDATEEDELEDVPPQNHCNAGGHVQKACTAMSCSTMATRGSFIKRAAFTRLMVAAKPRTCGKTRGREPRYSFTISSTGAVSPVFSTTI